ncbi:MAG: S9 family peptidase [Ignavibacteriales bacterium]|nr:S9 family peptidase [Ignavibacteriales bacterium]
MRLLSIVLFIIMVTGTMHAQMPPIIDRELFFGDPEISGAQISPDGKWISFVKPFNGVRNIWVKKTEESFENAKPLTNDTKRPVSSYFWSRGGKYILFTQDKGGDENFRVYAVNPLESGDPVPSARDLTPVEKIRAYIYDVPKKTPNEIIIGLNDRKPELHDVYKVNLETGERTLIRKNDENVAGWDIDPDGNVRLGLRQTPDGGTELLLVDGDNLKQIYSTTPEENFGTLRFTPDGKSIYITTNKGNIDKQQFELLDLSTFKTKVIEKDPLNEVDFGGPIFSDKTDKLLATTYFGDKLRIYFKDKQFEKDYTRMQKAMPKGEVSIANMTEDETVWMVTVSSDVDPGSRYLYDTKTGKVTLVYKSRPNLPSENLAPMRPVRYKARDGITIPAYLTVPKGVVAKNLPVVMWIHGGPWGRDVWGYNPYAQFLANRGYAVLQPNFRASVGYGKKFLNAGNKEWGTGAMQHDITDGVNYLIKEEIADPKKIGIGGGSYGGYATLAGLAFTPDVYAAGFSIVGPSNIITLLNSIPPYWAPMKKMFAVRVGDMDKPEEKKMLEEQSPLNSAKNIKAPLYVVQGANDPRVKKAESDQIVVATRDLGRKVEYMVAPDEGHGFAGRENRLAMIVAMERFFAKHLGGRVQEDVPPEIQKKLDDITVDISTVKMPEKSAPVAMPTTALMFNPALIKEGKTEYDMKMNMRGQQMAMTFSRTIMKAKLGEKDVVRIVESTSGAMGSGVDTVDYDATTLLPLRQQVQQGPASISFTFTDKSVTGTMMAGGQTMPINATLDGPTMPSSNSSGAVLATLPFAEGYQTTYSTFDIMSASTKKVGLKVLGKEKVTIAKGTFDAFKIEITHLEEGGIKSLYWVNAGDRTMLKSDATMPAAMGGGTMSSELK